MSELSKVDINNQIQVLRHNLLDLTMRNQLLNFRPRSMTVEVADANLAEIYERLVLRPGKRKPQMQFLPRIETVQNNPENSFESLNDSYLETEDHETILGRETLPKGDEANTNLAPEEPPHEEITDAELNKENLQVEKTVAADVSGDESSILWESPYGDLKAKKQDKSRFLHTNLTGKELQRRLFYINQRARSVMEEQGYNILYLALGFLKWKEDPDSTDFRKAPLILLPVEMDRKGVRKSFKFNWTGEDIISNISLQAKLNEEGIVLPDFEMPRTKEGVKEYLDDVKEAISYENRWEVVEDVYLGFFSFTKFVMYKDLDPESWPIDMPLAKNPLIKAIFDPSEEEDMGYGFREEDVDLKLTSQDVYHVMDADSSQIAVIEDVKNGRDMVVEGPPGTGKSQTIVNLIAELIVRGNTVLFVSEKMAALEVVKGRLDSIGLGEFCLELHSRKSNKKDVLEKLENTLRDTRHINISLKDDLNKREELKSELNEYVELLHRPYGRTKMTPFELYGLKEKSLHFFEKSGRKMPRFNIIGPKKWNLTQWRDANSKLKEIAELYKLVKPISKNPWKITQPDPILPAEEEEIDFLLNEILETLDELKFRASHLSKLSGVNVPPTLEEMEHLIAAVEIISSFPSLERELILNPKWDYDKIQVYKLIKSLEEFKAHKKFLKQFKENVLDENLELLLLDFKKHSEKILKFLSSDFKKVKKKVASIYLTIPPEDNKYLIHDLEELLRCQKLRNNIRNKDKLAQSLFGSHWKGDKSEVKNLKAISEWILNFRKALSEGRITEKVLIILDSSPQKEIKRTTLQLHQYFEEFLNTIGKLDNYLHFNKNSIFHKYLFKCSINDIKSEIFVLKDGMSELQNWSRYISSRNENLKTLAHNLVELIEKDEIKENDVIPCLEGNFADTLLRELFLTHPSLAHFVGDLHENKIKEFAELDQRIIRMNRLRISAKLHEIRPSLTSNATPHSELGILKSEFSRKRGHMPIRKLLSTSGSLIQNIKPCFMMSPLSVAQYLEPGSVKDLRFDYVIFDEASQVKPEDALGAVLRAKNAVIMGDTRQLPPTTFFDVLLGVDSEDYDLSAIADMESILHLCKRSFPSKMLRWHYRSRHESLIAVSNQEFYDNHLLIYPSPAQNSDDLGLKFIHLPDTVYDRGRSSTNLLEAKEVIKTAFEHYKKFGNSKSLGIGTFNVRQQQAILEELELQLKLNPEMEEHFSSMHQEHFFVKNLETIQGDERDVILVSVGYGFDSEGRLSLNFGPLNQDGGERRLNVLITRAREKCVVFSNFRGRNMELRSDAPFGLRALKEFLEYAETKRLKSIYQSLEDFESPFEESVYDFLVSNGYQVNKQVGCAGFRIDLAVLDSEYPGRYLMGIECDGIMYQSSPVARDRDRLRQQILEGLGWRFHRVWSTDWYRNRAEVQKNLLAAIEEIKNQTMGIEEFIPLVILEEVVEHDDELEFEETVELQEETALEEIEEEASLDKIPPYEICDTLEVNVSVDLHKTPIGEITKAIVQVVEVEGPIHLDEVVRRLRTYWGLKRAGKRVKSVITEAIDLAVLDGQIYQKDDFLYLTGGTIRVRERGGEIPAKMDLISAEEIEEAIRMVIREQFATAPDELVKQVSRIFGFKVARGATSTRIKEIIDVLKAEGMLEEHADGMIDLAKSEIKEDEEEIVPTLRIEDKNNGPGGI